MPTSVDQTDALADRFNKLKKLREKTKNLDKEITWEKKAFVPKYRRYNKKGFRKLYCRDPTVEDVD